MEFSCPVSGPTGSGPWIPDERYDPKATHGDHNYLPNGQEVLKYSSNNEIIPNIMNDLTSDISIAENMGIDNTFIILLDFILTLVKRLGKVRMESLRRYRLSYFQGVEI